MTLAPHASTGVHRGEAEKREIIHLVEYSALSVKKTLDELQVPRSTFSGWYKQYLQEGEAGLVEHRPNPRQVWNRIPQEVKQQVVELALEHPDRIPSAGALHPLYHQAVEHPGNMSVADEVGQHGGA